MLHDELLKAIRAVHAGQTYLPAAVAAALAAQMPRPDLSAREVQVLELIVRGLANKQIAYHAEHCRAHGQEPREEHPEQTGGAGSDPGGDRGHPARHHPPLDRDGRAALKPLPPCELR